MPSRWANKNDQHSSDKTMKQTQFCCSSSKSFTDKVETPQCLWWCCSAFILHACIITVTQSAKCSPTLSIITDMCHIVSCFGCRQHQRWIRAWCLDGNEAKIMHFNHFKITTKTWRKISTIYCHGSWKSSTSPTSFEVERSRSYLTLHNGHDNGSLCTD